MDRLIKVGTVVPKASKEIGKSRIGLGFEKLDRAVFDPEKAYPFVAQSGVKWARLQSGWQRTEKEKGVYDFEWLDKIVDNFLSVGVEPWICLCYGNGLYTEAAREHFGAVGCPPIHTQEERDAWDAYVKALVTHYKGRVHYYEVWNEPDGQWGWKHGPNATELGQFNIDTARACKEADPTCEVIGFCTCRNNRFDFLEQLAETGCCQHLDALSYHSYKIHDFQFAEAFKVYDDIRKHYNPKLKIIQGESGTQSRPDGNGALRKASWTPLKQAKFLLRHLITDISCGVEFTSYFSCMDMIEALNGKVGDVNSYLDYGYFGVIGADFDENGRSTGEYTPKPSFRALQTLCSILCEDYWVGSRFFDGATQHSQRMWGYEAEILKLTVHTFRKPNGARGVFYWNPVNILSETYEGTTSITYVENIVSEDVKLVDLLTGDIYKLPESMVERADGWITLKNIPVTDSPLLLTFGDFI